MMFHLHFSSTKLLQILQAMNISIFDDKASYSEP